MAEDLLVVIPAHNEASFIGELLERVRCYAPEILVVDDGSTDGTGEIARSAGVIVERHPGKRGKGAALRTGLLYAMRAGYRTVLTMDGDGQHDPADIPGLRERLRRGDAGIVLGCRARTLANMPLDRFLTNGFTSRAVSFLAGQKITDSQCGFRIFDSRVIPSLSFTASHFDAESEMLVEASRAGFRIVEAPVRTIYGREKSKQRPLMGTLRFFRFFFRQLFKKRPAQQGRAA